MATLLQKWTDIEILIKEMEESFLNDYFRDKERPLIVYQIQGWEYISEQVITKWGVSDTRNWQPQYYKYPTKKDLQRLLDWYHKFIPKDEYIFMYYTYTGNCMNVSGAHNLLEIQSDRLISFNKNDLIPILNDLQSIYAPKEGHSPCAYCNKQTPITQLIEYTIIARQYPNMRKTNKYCSETCGQHDQWAHEG